MKYLAAYVLLSLGGKAQVSEKDLSDFLKKVDSDVNEEQVKAVVAALWGKSLAELSQHGLSKISAMSVGSGNAAPTTGAAPAKAQPAKEEKKEEKVEEEAADLDLGDMFG